MNTFGEIQRRAGEIFAEKQNLIYVKTDKVFAYLMIVQWIAGIIFALVISPKTWIGMISSLHLHVYIAVFLGFLIALPPVVLAFARPGLLITRYIIAISQMLFSVLLIHLTGGRIETHFHVFGSLAFLAFYRDWKVLLLATGVIGIDHYVRGVFYPQSVFGIIELTRWRWLEHVAWVVFEDIFLFKLVDESCKEMRETSIKQAELEKHSRDLTEVNTRLEEFAYISAHDMKSPLISINNLFDILEANEAIRDGFTTQVNLIKNSIKQAHSTLASLNKVISFRKTLNLKGEKVFFQDLLNEVKVSLYREIEESKLEIKADFSECQEITYPKIHLMSIMQNLISNSIKYRRKEAKPIIRIQTKKTQGQIYLIVEDNGMGMDLELVKGKIFRLFQRFHFDIEGTGIGLHLVNSIVQSYGGSIELSSKIGEGTKFEILLSDLQDVKEEKHYNSFVLNR